MTQVVTKRAKYLVLWLFLAFLGYKLQQFKKTCFYTRNTNMQVLQ